MRRKVLALLVLVGAVVSSVHAEQISPMEPLFQEAARFWGVPVAWTQAIADVESGHNPWALNIEGKGYQFASKEKALTMAKQADAEGRSFDSGIMQVNNFWLKKYGIPLEAAFDPQANIYLGSWILKQEIDRHGQTWEAVGAYHSPNAARGGKYAEMVKIALSKGREPGAKMTHASSPAAAQKTKDMGEAEVVTSRGDHSRLIVSKGNPKPNNSSGQEGRSDQFVKRFARKI